MKHILTAIIIVLLGILGAIIIVPMVRESRPSEVTIAVEPTVSSTPIFYGYHKGVFDKPEVKIKAQIKKVENPDESIKGLKSGEFQFALLPWTEALKWMSEHPEDTLLCFFSVEYRMEMPQEGLFPKKGVTFKVIADLKGKTIGVTANDLTAIKAMLYSAEIPEEEVTLKVYPSDKVYSALVNGEVDYAHLTEPYYTLAKTNFGEPISEKGLLPFWVNFPYEASGLFTTRKIIEENQLALKRMNMAMQFTFLDFKRTENRDSARVLIANEFTIKDTQIIERINLPELERSQDMQKDAIQLLADKLEIYGAISKGLNLEELKVFVPYDELRF